MRSCKWCGRMHPVGYECPKKPKPNSNYKRRLTEARSFRNTAAWRRIRAEVNERDAHLCRVCLAAGIRCDEGLSTHHIIPLVETLDYASDPDWIITLCQEHHEAADAGAFNRSELHWLAMTPPKIGGCTLKIDGGGTPRG